MLVIISLFAFGSEGGLLTTEKAYYSSASRKSLAKALNPSFSIQINHLLNNSGLDLYVYKKALIYLVRWLQSKDRVTFNFIRGCYIVTVVSPVYTTTAFLTSFKYYTCKVFN